MKAARFRATIDELHSRLVALTATKGEEYKRREDNQFANFDRCARELGMTREQVLMVYLNKHLNSIITFIKDGAQGRCAKYAEPITGRIDDSILYLLILRGMVEDSDGVLAEPSVILDTETPQALNALDLAAAVKAGGAMPVFIARDQRDARMWCERIGVPAGSCALSSPDQLHGIKPPVKVYFVHHGNRADDLLFEEVKARVASSGIVAEIVAP